MLLLIIMELKKIIGTTVIQEKNPTTRTGGRFLSVNINSKRNSYIKDIRDTWKVYSIAHCKILVRSQLEIEVV